ncbi:alpha/beta fold hydrolase [Nocardia sp. CA-107356]|uniref:alpha/beta fold hydrolase n=1 Tax=Nocardia sp. CA-107356 TaxID=3239972 RepID=UPI003D8A5E22
MRPPSCTTDRSTTAERWVAGGGEVARYLSRHGSSHVAKAVLLGAVPPVMVKSDTNPEGTPIEVFDAIRSSVDKDRSQLYWDLSETFYGFNRPDATTSEGARRAFWRLSMQAGIRAAYECISQFSETDFTEDLKRIDVPVLVAHGDDDQIVPLHDSAVKSAELIKKFDPSRLPRRTARAVRQVPHRIRSRPARIPEALSSPVTQSIPIPPHDTLQGALP